MARFADLSISSFLDALASPDPTPGGGTAAAVAGGMGMSLLMMVAALAKSRNNTDQERLALGEAHPALASIRKRMLDLADIDAAAFEKVMAAYRLPKASDDEKAARKTAVHQAYRAATDAPLETLRAAEQAARLAKVVAQHGNRSASSDVRVAIELLEAAAAGAAANVDINLDSVGDEAYRKSAAADVIELTNRLREHTVAARAALV